MRLLHVTPSYAPCVGGAERMLQAVSQELVERGHEVTVLTFDCATQKDFDSPGGAGLPAREDIHGVQVERVPPDGGRLGRLHHWWLGQRGGWRTTNWIVGGDSRFAFSPPNGLAVIPPLLLANADLICSVNWCFGVSFWTTQVAKLRRIPHVAVPILHIDRPWAGEPVYERMLGSCDAVIALTDAEAGYVAARGGRSVSVGGAGVDPDRFSNVNGVSVRARYGLGSRPVVGFVGRQDEGKGVPTLVQAMTMVWEQTPETVLLLAGPSAHRKPVVDQVLRSLPERCRRNVLLIDDFPDRDGPAILNTCDIVALPSIEEAFGLVLVEAWMCGKPVIGADIAPTRCLIQHGVDGWMVKPLDSEDLAARLLDLLGSRERREAFGQRGREKVLSRYTWSRVADLWEHTYRAVLDARGLE